MEIPGIYLLAASLLTLAAGPLLYQTARAARLASPLLAALDGFVFVAITGLVLLHVLPESVALGGWAAVLACLVGLMAPTLLEHRLHGRARQVHAVALLLGLAALGLHAFMDGLVLGGGHQNGDGHVHRMLPMAVILHRLPEGLMIWFLVRPLYGLPKALATLAMVAVSTLTGFWLSAAVAAAIEHQGRGLFQALVGGSLLHVVMHRSYPISPDDTGPRRLQAGLGALGGLGLLWAITHDGDSGLAQAGSVFYTLALESAPALLLAYVGAGLVFGFLPRASVAWMSRGSSLSQALRGMAFGVPLTICSCGVVPVYRSLVLQGIPVPAALAFLIATPELSLDAVLLSLPLLGGPFTLVRLACAAFVALAIGWGLGRLLPPAQTPASAPALELDEQGHTTWDRLRSGLATGLGEVVASTAPWILLGLAIAAVVEPLIADAWFQALPAWLEVAVFALLGIPTYVCASGATPLAAVLIHKGVSPGAALAFLLTGPATNITTFGLLSRLHGRRAALAFGGLMALLAVLLGHLVNLLLPRVDTFPQPHVETGVWAGVQTFCLAAVAALFLAALLRNGPRAFVGELFPEADDEVHHDHDHGHDHHHGHHHGGATSPHTEDSCCR
ncbi:MAG: permease [Candidatus Latescibacteria bacterium]|nr:permease [Candidatus Latescibacterota bacterium]